MANSAGGVVMWTIYNDFYQDYRILSNDYSCEDYLESMQQLREYELQKDLDRWELWRDDPAFGDDDE